jgi:multidrug efflux system membrane fusion protein
LLADTLKDATVIPTAAVQRGSQGTFAYAIRPDRTVTVRPLKLGPSAGERVAVLSGLEPGDQIVVDGADRLREGTKVTLPSAAAEHAGPGAGSGTGRHGTAQAQPEASNRP